MSSAIDSVLLWQPDKATVLAALAAQALLAFIPIEPVEKVGRILTVKLLEVVVTTDAPVDEVIPVGNVHV